MPPSGTMLKSTFHTGFDLVRDIPSSLAFFVENIEEYYTTMSQKGASLHWASGLPWSRTAWMVRKAAYCQDPDNNWLEFVEVTGMILLIDNYDSFTYNLYQYLCELGAQVTVARNDHLTLDDIEAMFPEGIVISPGPCTPKEAGISNDVIRRYRPPYTNPWACASATSA